MSPEDRPVKSRCKPAASIAAVRPGDCAATMPASATPPSSVHTKSIAPKRWTSGAVASATKTDSSSSGEAVSTLQTESSFWLVFRSCKQSAGAPRPTWWTGHCHLPLVIFRQKSANSTHPLAFGQSMGCKNGPLQLPYPFNRLLVACNQSQRRRVACLICQLHRCVSD